MPLSSFVIWFVSSKLSGEPFVPVFDMISMNSFRVVFPNTPPRPAGNMLALYFLRLTADDGSEMTGTLKAEKGAEYTFDDLSEGTTYNLDVQGITSDYRLLPIGLPLFPVTTRE